MTTLREFAQELSALPFMQATIAAGHAPGMWHLVTAPKYRPEERSTMLTFWVNGASISAINARDATFKDTAELTEFLGRFLRETDFPNTMREYKARFEEDVEGRLRVGGREGIGADDVPVLVPHEEHLKLAKLAEASPGTEIELVVARAPGKHDTYTAGQAYRYLTSAGYAVEIASHEPGADGKLVVRGKALGVQPR